MIVATLTGNRPVPKWQGFSHHSLTYTVTCTARVLSRFGQVTRETGRKPESGLVRLLLRHTARPKRSPPVVVAYLDGDAGFSSIFMEATDRRTADTVWRDIKQHCGLPESR